MLSSQCERTHAKQFLSRNRLNLLSLRERVLTVAYYALVRMLDVKGGDDAAKAEWFALDEVPSLAFVTTSYCGWH